MKFIANADISDEKWIDLSNNCKFASPFQTRQFCEISKAIPNYAADIYAVEQNGKYLALFVLVTIREPGALSYFSRRGIVYGGPLIRDNNTDALAFLIKKTESLKRGDLIYLEVRNFFDYYAFRNTYLKIGWEYRNYLNYVIGLDNQESCLMSIKAEKRRQIRKAIKNGAIIEYHDKPAHETVDKLYALMQNLYYKKVKKPLPPRAFFGEMAKFGQCMAISVNYRGDIIGGGFVLFSQDVIYDWFRVGDDVRFKALYPSTLAAWAAIKLGLQLGCKWFDFMGAGYSGKEYGVRKFKSQFGGELVENGRFIKVLSPVLFLVGRIGLKLMAMIQK